jgi:hypothetical protein
MLNEIMTVSTDEAISMARQLAIEEGELREHHLEQMWWQHYELPSA